MEEVRCPMCGKPNPADLDVCRFCEARLRPVWDPESPASSEPSTGDEDLPDWLRSLGTPDPKGSEAEPAAEELWEDQSGESDAESADFTLDAGDWLSRIGVDAPPHSTEDVPPPTYEYQIEEPDDGFEWRVPEDEDLPDWLKRAEIEQPDWLKRTESTGPAADVPVAADLPEWLIEPTALPQAPGAETVGDADSEPQAEESGAQEQPTGLEAEFDSLPDLLAEPEAFTDLPEWLAGAAELSQTEVGAADSSGAPGSPDFQADLPDWITSDAATQDAPDLEFRETPADIPSQLESIGAPSVESPAKTDAAADDDLAAWLSALEADDDAVGDVILSKADETEAEGDLSWLSELEAAQTGLDLVADDAADALSVEGAFDDAPAPSGLPGWLGQAAAEAETPEKPPEAADDLGVAELPSWLQAMRPLGATEFAPHASAPTGEDQVEGAGPLAGLRGVLPAEPDITRIEKTAADIVRLQISDAQEVQVKLLSEMIELEAQSPTVIPRSTTATGAALRLAVSLLLLVSLLVAIFTGLPAYRLPLPPAEVVHAVQLIESLPAGAPALVIVDYEPGYSAEMDPLTRSVVVHLIQRGLVPVFVSTLPTGPMQIQRLVTAVRADDGQPLESGRHYTNLGYLPGGALGMANFAAAPRSAFVLDGSEVPALQPVDSLDDFAVAIVATESPERARGWVEQTRFRLGDRPLMMLTSAQAEPLVRPYYDSAPAQVAALVGGLRGAVAYEINTGQVSTAAGSWSPYNLGLILATIFMVLGGVVSWMGSRITGRREQQAVKGASGRNE